MKLTLGGVRGSSPVTDPAFAKFGGDTTSFAMTDADDNTLLVDIGTGIRYINSCLNKPHKDGDLLLLLTHYHLDHIIGFPFFNRIYDRNLSLKVVGPRLGNFSAKNAIKQIMAQPYWPLQLDSVQASIQFSELAPSSVTPLLFHGVSIRWCPVHHQGGCVAYRFDEAATGHSLVIATDIEWRESTHEEKNAFLQFCQEPAPPDLLVFDGHLTPENYDQYRGWGHSTWADAVQVAREIGDTRLLITHHSPYANDTALQAVEDEMKSLFPEAALARQGQIIEIES